MLKNVLMCNLALSVALIVPSHVVRAQDTKGTSLPVDTKVVSHIDVQSLQKSPFGKRLTDLIMERVLEAIAEEQGIAEPSVDDATNFLGFNPIEDTTAITLVASDLEQPEKGLLTIVDLKKTTGNLESVLSAHVPGYSLKKVGKYDVHTGSPDGQAMVHLVIRTGPDGAKSLVISPNEELLTKQLDRLDTKTSGGDESLVFAPTPGNLVEVRAQDIPIEKLGEGPQTIIFSMVQKISLALKEIDGKLNLVLGFEANSDENAEQLDQILQGFVPMIESAIPDFTGVEVTRDGGKITLLASIGSERAGELLDEQFDGIVDQVEGMIGSRLAKPTGNGTGGSSPEQASQEKGDAKPAASTPVK